jgi:hypothetical protein
MIVIVILRQKTERCTLAGGCYRVSSILESGDGGPHTQRTSGLDESIVSFSLRRHVDQEVISYAVSSVQEGKELS